MKCPFCGHVEDKVVDSRESKEGEVIRRRRECLGCGKRFTSYERIDQIPHLVVKKDGRRERFDREKLLAGLMKACEKRPVLSVTRGPGMGLVYEVKTSAPTSLGRAKVNDIVLNADVAVSSEHCRIRPEEGGFVLHDLKSTNGTFVNDRRVTRQPLTEGDTIQVGETYLQFRLEHRRS